METQTGVYVLENGSGSIVDGASLIESTEKIIDIQYFIFFLQIMLDWLRVII